MSTVKRATKSVSHRLCTAAVAVGFWLAPLAATADSAAAGASAPLSLPADTMGSVFPSLWRLFGALLIVLVLVWGTMWVARRVLKGRWSGVARSDLKVVDRVYLAPRRSIELVAIGERILVLGVTDNQIAMLTELKADEWPSAAAKAAVNPGAAPRMNTSADLWRRVGRRLSEGLKRVRAADTVPPISEAPVKS